MGKPLVGLAAITAANVDVRVDAVNRAYIDAVVAAGGLPILLPIQNPADAADVVASIDGLVLCGGVDIDPAAYGAPRGPDITGVDLARDAWELALVAAAEAARVPVLGVCRGAQMLNVSAGGTLVRDVPQTTGMNHRDKPRDRQVAHDVLIEPDSLLAELCVAVSLGVNTLHHQAVDCLGQGFRPVAWAPDSTIEAIESTTDWPAIGVQWHPELLVGHLDDAVNRPHRALFSWLQRAAQAHRMRFVPGDLGAAPLIRVRPQPVAAGLERQAS